MTKRKIFLGTLIVLIGFAVTYFVAQAITKTDMSIYDIKVKDTQGQEVSMSEYKGKVLLIVNTATECGFTPQYKELQDLYLKYKDQGFEILDFPCNQFGGQAPGTNDELAKFCELKYHTTFKTFGKIEVNGDNTDPLFVFLKDNSKGFFGKAIKWNFTKFLVTKDGKLYDRYAPTTTPMKIEKDIEKLLKEDSE